MREERGGGGVGFGGVWEVEEEEEVKGSGVDKGRKNGRLRKWKKVASPLRHLSHILSVEQTQTSRFNY